jgi:hypothetical protein
MQFDMRAGLGHRNPTDLTKRTVNSAGLCTLPDTHAEAQVTLMERGTDLDCSTRSAITLKARAYALALACLSVLPYESTPGISLISAIQRPSSSRPVSMRKYNFGVTDRGGFLLRMRLILPSVPIVFQAYYHIPSATHLDVFACASRGANC